MPSLSIIDQIIEAIDSGKEITLDWESLANNEEKKKIKALLSVHKISTQIKKKQSTAMNCSIKTGMQWMHLVIKEKIGAGGFGQVFRAYDAALETDVAVKFLNKDAAIVDESAFLREARLMTTVRNPHVLAIHGAGTDQGVSGYWSDYLDGEILYKHLQKKHLDDNDKMRIIKQITFAVKATHNNNVVHGDIKSLNVMLQPHRGAILLDFGSGRSGLKAAENNQLLQASPIAMAPEQFNGEKNSLASDVFALGLLFMEILTGQHPLVNKNFSEIKAITQNMPEVIHGMNLKKGWRRLLARMLAVDSHSRPSIQEIDNNIVEIEQKPLKRAKQVALMTSLALLFGVSISSLYSYFNIKQANQQTEVINTLLYDNFLTIERYKEGKGVTLVQVMDRVGDKILENKDLSQTNQEKLLVRMVGTYLTLSDLEHVITLGERVLALSDLEILSQMKVMRYVGLAHSHRREFAQAETKLLGILDLTASTEAEYDAQIKAINPLVFGYLDHNEFNKVPPILEKLEQIQPHGSNRPIMLGAIAHTKALYYNSIKDHIAAHDAFMNAAEFYTEHFHAQHYSVLDAYSHAASEHIEADDAELKQNGVKKMLELLPQMKEVMGAEHNSYLIAQINLAVGYSYTNQAPKAITLLLSIQNQVYEKLGRNNLMSLLLFDRVLANSYAADKQLEKANGILLETVRMIEQEYPDDYRSILEGVYNWLDFLLHNDLYDQAQVIGKKYLQLANVQLGEHHRMSLKIKVILARINSVIANDDKNQLAAIYELHVELFGEDDHQTRALKNIIDTPLQ